MWLSCRLLFSRRPTPRPLHPLPAAPAAAEPVAALVVNAAAYLVVEATSGRVRWLSPTSGSGATRHRSPLMTAYLVFDALHQKKLSLTQRLRVPERAWKAEGSRMFIEPGAPVTTEDLLRGLIIQSGNDAAVALAIAVAGNEGEFIARMNREAKRLGMDDTQFLNPTGLSQQGHYSTAHDLRCCRSHCCATFRTHQVLRREELHAWPHYPENRNRLLFLDPTVDGLKTGHTDSAGWCLIATVNRPPRKLLTCCLRPARRCA